MSLILCVEHPSTHGVSSNGRAVPGDALAPITACSDAQRSPSRERILRGGVREGVAACRAWSSTAPAAKASACQP